MTLPTTLAPGVDAGSAAACHAVLVEFLAAIDHGHASTALDLFTEDASFTARGQQLRAATRSAGFLTEREAETDRQTVHTIAKRNGTCQQGRSRHPGRGPRTARAQRSRSVRHRPRPRHRAAVHADPRRMANHPPRDHTVPPTHATDGGPSLTTTPSSRTPIAVRGEWC
jgi:hypothetical protein